MPRVLAVLVVLLAVTVAGAFVAMIVSNALGGPVVAAQLRGGPPQPIKFPHPFHVKGIGLDCAFCHRNATQGASAGIPSVQQCMFCHAVAGQGKPEAEKVRAAWENQAPINWVRVHRLPDHVRFLHEAHLQVGFTCATCHGDVASMEVVQQVRPLNMGDCVACHRQNNAPTDCTICHK